MVCNEAYVQQAKLQGYPVEFIRSFMSASTRNYATFGEFLSDLNIYAEQCSATDPSLLLVVSTRKSYMQQLLACECDPTPLLTLENLIRSKTMAVTAMDMLYEAEHKYSDTYLNLRVFEQPVYSLIIQFNERWVQDVLIACLLKWEGAGPRRLIEEYFKSTNTPEEEYEQRYQYILASTPTYIRQDIAPDNWKVYQMIQAVKASDSCEFTTEGEDTMNYYDCYIECLKRGAPTSVAEDFASRNTVKNNPSLLQRFGTTCGKVASFKYNTAKSFQEAFDQGLGSYSTQYYERKNSTPKPNSFGSKLKDLDQRIADEPVRQPQQQQWYNQGTQNYWGNNYPYQNHNNQYGYNYFGPMNYNHRGNFTQGLSTKGPVIFAILCSAVLLLLLCTLGYYAKAVISGVGCILAILGLVEQCKGKPSTPKIVLGLIIAVIGIFC